MAVWQTGITWAPSPELVQSNYGGALQHVAKKFASWTRQVASSIRAHKEAPRTVEANMRSGKAWGQHGLSQDEVELRKAREQARGNYHWASKLQASKGRGKGGQPWHERDRNDRWWLYQFWDGSLEREMQEANAS